MSAGVAPPSGTCLLLSLIDGDDDGGAPLDRAVMHFKERGRQ